MARRKAVPEVEGRRRDQEGPADAPPPPPSGSSAPSGTEDIEAGAKALRELKMTPQLCKDVGDQFAAMEATFYTVCARALDDERWKLAPEEIEAQARLAATGLLVYGDLIKAWVIPAMLVFGFSGPLVARLLILGPKEKSNLGGPPERKPVRSVPPS
jgi:hypothetical protein